MVLEVADRDAVWNLWQTPTRELQHRPLDIWSETLTSFADNYSPFKETALGQLVGLRD